MVIEYLVKEEKKEAERVAKREATGLVLPKGYKGKGAR